MLPPIQKITVILVVKTILQDFVLCDTTQVLVDQQLTLKYSIYMSVRNSSQSGTLYKRKRLRIAFLTQQYHEWNSSPRQPY